MAAGHVRTQRPFTLIEEAALDDFLGSDIGLGMFFDRKGQPIGMIGAGRLKWDRPGYERVGHTTLPGRLGPVEISTVWLGANHNYKAGPPLIFETMIFWEGEDLHLSCWRYPTVRQAEIGHRQVVRLVKLLQRPPQLLVKSHKTRNRHWR